MATLHVRNVPDDLYAQLQDLATVQNRSISAQVVHLLDSALQFELQRQAQIEILAGIRRRRSLRSANESELDSLALLREDRDR